MCEFREWFEIFFLIFNLDVKKFWIYIWYLLIYIVFRIDLLFLYYKIFDFLNISKFVIFMY